MQSFLVALAFLTILPVRFRVLPPPAVVARSRLWYPLVGLVVGAILSGWTTLVLGAGSPSLSAYLVLLAWVVLTGALHVDGFCDLLDGLFGAATAEERLRIMRDPHPGAFGLTGAILLLLGKYVLLQEVITRAAPAALLAGTAAFASRCTILLMAAGARYPRPDGTGKALIEATRWPEAVLFAILAVAVTGPLAAWGGFPMMAWPAVLAALSLVVLRQLCVRRLSGITGDCLGAGIEGAEVVFLFTALAVLRMA